MTMESPFAELFGEGVRGRPLKEEEPMGISTGDPQITEAARRRATRVIKWRHRKEFESLMAAEAAYLQSHDAKLPVGEG